MANTFNVAKAVVNLDAGTAEFTIKMAQAGATMKNFGAEGEASAKRVKEAMRGIVPEQLAASAAIRSLEGNPGIRAAERFLTTTLGLRNVISAAFPAVGFIAFADVLYTGYERAKKFFDEIAEGSARVKNAFIELTNSTRLQNDALTVTNDKLENEIAKLTGKPQNGLKLALDEAKKSADELVSSLNKGLTALYKLADQESSNAIVAFFKNQTATNYIPERIGGKTGSAGAIEKVNNLTFDAENRIDSAKSVADANAIRTQVRAEAQAILGPLKASFEADLQRANSAKVVFDYLGTIKEPGLQAQERGSYARQGIAVTGDPRKEITELQGVIRELATKQRLVDTQFQNGTLEQGVSSARANESNDKLTKPYDAAIANLKGKIAEVNTLITAAGSSDAAKVIAKGLAEAAKEAEKLNEQLKKEDQLNPIQRAELNRLATLEAQGQARQKLLAQADEEVKKSNEAVAAQRLIADAIGKTYEASRTAAVQIEVLKKLGDSADSGEPNIIAARRRIEFSAGAAFDAEHNTQTQNSIFLLKQEAEAQQLQALAVQKGAAALREEIEAEKEYQLIRTESVLGNSADAAHTAFLTGEAKNSAERTQNLKQEAADIRTLAAAYVQGAEAIKDAQLKIEQAKIQRNTPAGVDAKPEQTAAADKDHASRQAEVTKTAGQAVTHYQDQLDALEKQRAAIQAMTVTDQNRLGIAIALKQIYDEQNRIIREQVLAVGTATDGARQFLRDLVTDTQSAASKIYESMRAAYDGVNTNLAKLLTGQKTSWASFFKELGEMGVKNQLQQIEKGVIGAIGGGGAARSGNGSGPWSEKLPSGIGSLFGLGKRDGSTPTTALYVSPVSLTGGVGGALGTLTRGSESGSGDDEDDSTGIFSKILKGLFGGFHADGGDIDAGKINVVGERGPELFIPRSSGTVVPNSAIRGAGAGSSQSVTQNFIAVGEDPAAVQRASSRAMVATHNAAVSNAIRVINDRSLRTPQQR